MKKVNLLKYILVFVLTTNSLAQSITEVKHFTSTFELLNQQMRKQFLMASQSYGTSYALYADITLLPVTDEGIKRREVKSLAIELRNYRTNLFLSIDKLKIHERSGVIDSIDVYVRANMVPGNRRYPAIKSTDTKSYYLDKGEYLKIRRFIMPMNYVPIPPDEYNDSLVYNDEAEKFKNVWGTFKIYPWNKGKTIVDTEFFFMDGIKFTKLKARYDDKEFVDKSPGFRCKTGTLLIR